MIVLIGSEKRRHGKDYDGHKFGPMRASAGRDVLLVDTDPQGSTSYWSTVRTEGKAARIGSVQKFGNGLQSEVCNLSKRYDDVLIDAGGRDSVELRAACALG